MKKVSRFLSALAAIAFVAALSPSRALAGPPPDPLVRATGSRVTASGGAEGAISGALLDATIVPLFWLRADSASGTGPYTVPGNAGPWVDVARNHDAQLYNFTGTPASGWKGDGTPANPYRLEFAGEEQGSNTRVTIPGGSIPELQTVGATSTSVWFKTGFDGANLHYDYVVEYVQRPAEPFDPEYEGRGLSIIVHEGKLKVYANPWIDVTDVTPDTWYHVAVVKDTNDMRIYVNGDRLHTGIKSHRGTQESEVVLGASTFRVFEGFPYPYTDFFTGAIAQVMIAQGAMSDAQVRTIFRADSALYLPSPRPLPATQALVRLRANLANGSGPYASPGAGSPWVDLISPAQNADLQQFDGTATSGWQGNGTIATPYCLRFDGLDDRVVIPSQSLGQLQNASAYSAEMWVKPGADLAGPDYRYLFEWLAGQGSVAGMSLAIANGNLQLYTGTPYWTDLGPIALEGWHHVVVAKQPGEVRVYLDGSRIHTGIFPLIGDQTSEILLGASTWRGPQVYGDFLPGDVRDFTIWEGALVDSQVTNAYLASTSGVAGIEDWRPAASRLELAGFRPNPVRDRLRVSLALASGGPATLELIDVTGRRVRGREIGSLGPGRHVVDLGAAQDLRAGVYFLRVTQEGQSRTAKATIVR